MTTTQHAGSTIEVKPRRLDFSFDQIKTRYWYDGNPLLTTYFAALSATFPPGEQSFIDSIRPFREKLTDDTLKEQVRGFIGQEGHHGHQHRKINRHLTTLGLPVTALEEAFEKHIKQYFKNATPEAHLAHTVAVEHMTALFAEHWLTHPEMGEPMHPVAAELLSWHAVEEIEHKAVAFDVYMQCVGDRKLLRKSMREFTFNFIRTTTAYQARMLYANKTVPGLGDFRGFYKAMFGRNGMMSQTRSGYLEFFKEDFHPWNNDNSYLIEDWKKQHRSQEAAEAEADQLMVVVSH